MAPGESAHWKGLLERERAALATHREALRRAVLPIPREAPKGTFVHGFLLPFWLIAATLRDRELRRPYLRVALVRGLIVAGVGLVAITTGKVSGEPRHRDHGALTVHRSADDPAPVHVERPGLRLDFDTAHDKASIAVLGVDLPTEVRDERRTDAAPTPALGALGHAVDGVRHGWAWLLALLAVLSAAEAVAVFLSRRWDDWTSFHASRLAAIRPEDPFPKEPRAAVDLPWLYRKVKRRARGYLVFGAGLPALLPLRLVPTAGPLLFTVAVTAWGWYWVGVFTAAKSAHAWADEERARSPAPIRALNDRVSRGVLLGPVRAYGRLWAWLTRGVNPAAATFERSPWAFLGLALARIVLSLPGLYLLARPVVPVAAGRLCAEADPEDRFSVAREGARPC
jgi:hypothetical protein